MTIQRQLANKVAICRAKVQSQGRISIKTEDVNSIGMQPGDELRVRISKTDLGSKIRPRDSDTFSTTLQKSLQVNIPESTIKKLDLSQGEIIQYIILPTKEFPGISNGPVRDRVSDGGRQQQRTAGRTTFQGPKMRQTGKIRVPAGKRDELGLQQGDTVTVTVEWNDQTDTFTGTFGTQDRVTIPKDTRDTLGLEQGDQPEITLAVF